MTWLFFILAAIAGILFLLGSLIMLQAWIEDGFLAQLSRRHPEVRTWGYDEYQDIKKLEAFGGWITAFALFLAVVVLVIGATSGILH